QPPHGRVPARGPGRLPREPGARLRPLPGAGRAAGPAGGEPVGRRAADAGHRPGPHVAPEAHPARRAVDGPGAGDGPAPVRPHPAGARRGLHDPDRRAERAAGAEAGRPGLPARGGAHPHRGAGRPAPGGGVRPPGLRGAVMDPLFLAEAAVNGLLLGGVLALLALGLNLIFGVVDIVWIAYVDLVMVCMYAVYFLVMVYAWPVWLAGL